MGNFKLHNRQDEMHLREVIKNSNVLHDLGIRISAIGKEADGITINGLWYDVTQHTT